MGGLVTRQIVTSDYRPAIAFGAPVVHKLITLGTPHRGSPQAVLQLLPESACSRNDAVNVPQLLGLDSTVSVSTFDMNIGSVPGAAGELSGNGKNLTDASQALIDLDGASPIGMVPSSLLAGDANDVLPNVTFAPILEAIRRLCKPKNDPLAQRFSRNRYAWIFDPNIYPKPAGSTIATPSDGSVSVTSAIPQGLQRVQPFPRYLHSSGIGLLTSPTAHQLLDGSEPIVSQVRKLLNEKATSNSFIH